MKKVKTYNLFNKIRAALRDVYRYSPMRKEAVKKAQDGDSGWFLCPICLKKWPIQMADVDHEPPIGPLTSVDMLDTWAETLFYGNVQVICKLCHKKKTAAQRKRK
jgi:hypothetical protein